jgi:hypothetical protein
VIKTIIVCFLLVLLCSLSIVSVDAASTWIITFGGSRSDQANSLVATSDGGYAIAGCAYYSNPFYSDFWLVKTDAFGNTEWSNTYGNQGTVFEKAYSLVEASDGGYVLAGSTNTFPTGNSGFCLVKTDALGNTQWNQTYGGTGQYVAQSLVEAPDGGYTVVGSNWTLDVGSVVWLVKTDSDGVMEWNRTYAETGDQYASSIVATSGGGYAIAGGANGDFWLAKIDVFGNVEWNRTYGGSGDDVARSLVSTSDGGYALAGHIYLNDTGNVIWIVKTDAAGNMQWNQTYDEGSANSLVDTRDGGYALAGYTSTNAACLVKTDALGNMQWARAYVGGEPSDFALSLIETSDGGYAITGYNGSSRDIIPLYDSWLIKTDENGMVPTPTPTPAPAPTAITSPSPTPSIPEFPSTTLLPLLAGLVALSIIFSKTKRIKEMRE